MFLVDKLVKPLSNRINLDALTGTFSEAIRGLSVNVAQKDKVVTALNHSTSNMKGADATLTAINCIKTNNSDSHTAIMSTGQIFTTGSVFSADILVHGSTGGSNRQALLGGSGVNGAFVVLGGVPKYRTNGLANDLTFSTLSISDNVNYNIKFERTAADTLVCTLTNLDTGAVDTETGTLTSIAQTSYLNIKTLDRVGMSGSVKCRIKFTNVVYNNWKYPMQEGSGTRCFDIGGEGNHITLGADIWDTAESRASHNHEYGFTPAVRSTANDGSVDTGVRIDSANIVLKARFLWRGDSQDYLFGIYNATASQRFLFYQNNTQIRLVTPNGAHDLATTASIQDKFVDLEITSTTATLNGTTTSIDLTGVSQVADLRIFSNNVGTANADCDIQSFSLVKDGTLVADYTAAQEGKFYDRVSNSLVSGTGTLVTNNIPALSTKTTQVVTFDGNDDKLTATGITSSSVITHDGTATLTAGTGEITSTAGTAYNIKVDGVLTFTMSSGIGTSTIPSVNGLIGNASVVGSAGALETFWGTRVADTAGSLVSADYASGNTTISNPLGFVHNSSECGVKLQKATKLNFYEGVTGIAYAPVALTAGTYDFEMEITITHRADHVDYRSFFGGWNVGGTNGAVTIHSSNNMVYLIAKATDGTVVAGSSNGRLTNTTAEFEGLFGIPTTYTVKRVGNTIKGFRDGVEKFSRDCTGKSFGNTFLNHYPIGYNGTSGTPDNTTLGVTIGDITYHRVRYTEGTSRDFEYNFSEASGNSLNDLSGNGNHGVVTSGAEGLVTRWSDSYIEYPADLHQYSFIPAQLIVTDCTDTSLNHTYTIEDTQNGELRWVFNGDLSTKIYFNTGSNRWTIQDSGGSVTKVGDTQLPAEGSYGSGAVLAYSNHGLFLSTTGINITKLAQYDTDETTLTSTEKANNERYFG